MSAGGVELSAFFLAHAWKATTALVSGIAALAYLVAHNRNKIIESNKQAIEALTKSNIRLESAVSECVAQIAELNTIKDRSLVLEAKVESLDRDVSESKRDIKILLSRTNQFTNRDTN